MVSSPVLISVASFSLRPSRGTISPSGWSLFERLPAISLIGLREFSISCRNTLSNFCHASSSFRSISRLISRTESRVIFSPLRTKPEARKIRWCWPSARDIFFKVSLPGENCLKKAGRSGATSSRTSRRSKAVMPNSSRKARFIILTSPFSLKATRPNCTWLTVSSKKRCSASRSSLTSLKSLIRELNPAWMALK